MRELSLEEQRNIDGGILPVIIAAGQIYLGICALSVAAGAGTAFVQNRINEKKK